MRRLKLGLRELSLAVFVAAIGFNATTDIRAASGIIEPVAGYRADDIHTTITVRGHDTYGDLSAIYDGGAGLQIFDRSTSEHYDLGDSGNVGDSWNSFVTFSPDGGSIWIGYDYNIYEITSYRDTPTWNHRATLSYNFDLAFSAGIPYVSGLNTDSYGPNSIWRLDTTGNDDHALVASTGGFSAGIDFDQQGNLYYATNLGADDKLVRYSNEQVGTGNLELADAELLSDIPYSACDTEVDDAGNVIFDFSEGGYFDETWTQLSSTLAVWNGTVGEGENFDLIGTGGLHHWFTLISTDGNVLDGDGKIYLADGGYIEQHPGLAEIRSVPEPTAFVLLASGMLVWLIRRRK